MSGRCCERGKGRFAHYAALHGFVPWVVSLLVNHYDTVGYVPVGLEVKG